MTGPSRVIPTPPLTADEPSHYAPLDGLRAVSILLVLAAHMLPLGPHRWGLNEAAGVAGMGLFFALSGFLVTQQLLTRPHVPSFLLRRGARVLPLAWTYMALALWLDRAAPLTWLQQALFFANLPPQQAFTPRTAHLWSLCVELQFYLLAALTVATLGLRGLYGLLLLCVAITLWRIVDQVYASSRTQWRGDEILAGACLALLRHRHASSPLSRLLARLPAWPVVLLYLGACLEPLLWLAYARPYLALLLVGVCLAQPQGRLGVAMRSKQLAYIAGISYALYVLHPLLQHSWLGSGEAIERYAKLPLLLVALCLLAHASTFSFEHRWTAWARRLSGQWQQRG